MQLKFQYPHAVAKMKPEATPVTKVAQEKSPKKSEATGKKASKNPNTKCEITGATINNISSFRFGKIDVVKQNYIISFISKDGLTETEYCPKFIVENNEKTLNFINGNPTYQNKNSYSNSTKRIPGSFSFRPDIDSVSFPVGTRNQFWKENKTLIEMWMLP